MIFVVAALGWSAKAWLESAIPAAGALDPASGAVLDAAAQAGDENVLVVAAGPAARADAGSIVVAHVPAGGDGVVALSFPPTLEINRPPCERWNPATATYLDQTVPAEARTRLASAFDVGGPRCVTRVVQQLTGLAITRFLALGLGGVAPVVDAVGGVAVCVERPVTDAVLGPVVSTAGTSALDAAKAGDLVLAADVPGDPATARIERQHRVIAAALDEVLSVGTLLDPTGLRTLAAALRAATLADGLGLDQMLVLAGNLSRLEAEGVTFVAVPTAADPNGRGDAVLREADAAALFAALRDGTTVPPQDPPHPPAPGPTPAAQVTVDVLNASGRAGLAGRVGQALGRLGFGVGDVRNAEQAATDTVIRFSPDRSAEAQLLASVLPAAAAQPAPGASGLLEVVLGSGFDDVVRTPAAPAPAPTAACT